MKSILVALVLILILAPFALASVAIQDDGTYEGEATYINFAGSDVSFSSDTATVDLVNINTGAYKYALMPISSIDDPVSRMFAIGGIATDITASGIYDVAGVMEIGSAEGYVHFDDAADYILFYLPLPETFYYGGSLADLVLGLDLSNTGSTVDGTRTIQVNMYEDGSETGLMLSDELSSSRTARTWVDFTGFGNDVSITGVNETLIVKINTETDNDDARLYGARLTYLTGLDTN